MQSPVRTLLKHLLGQPKKPQRTRLTIGGLEDRTVPATPTLTVANASVSGNEGGPAILNSGTFSDADVGDTVAVSADDGTLLTPAAPVLNPASAPWTWSISLNDDAGPTTVTISAFDGTTTGTTSFTYTVNNVPPTFTNASAINVAEGNTFVVNLTSTDPGADIPTYSITGGADQGLFSLAGNALSFTSGRNFETPTDADTNGVYEVTVQVDDGDGGIVTQNISVTVTNIAPSVPVDSNAAANTVAEGSVIGTLVGVTASSTDTAGTQVGGLVYSLTNDAGGRFQINSSTGVVSVANPAILDGDVATVHTITAQASDGNLTSTQNFNITVTNVAPTGTTTTTPAPAFAISPTVNTIVRNSPHTFTINGITDPIAALDEPYTITWNYGDGSAPVVVGGLTYAVLSGGPHSQTYNFPNTGTFNTTINVSDGLNSTTYTYVVNVVAVAVINGELHIGGTPANNIATITPGTPANSINVILDNVLYGPFSPASVPTPFPAGAPIRFFGGAGTDTFIVAGTGGNDTFTVGADVPNGATNLVMDKQFSFNTWPTITTKDAEAYQMKGGNGDDSFTVDGIGTDATSVLNDTNVFLEGGMGADSITTTLTAAEVGGSADWAILGPQRGSLETNLTFNWVESVIDAGGLDDNFTFSNGATMPGAPGLPFGLVGGGGTNTMNMAASTTAVNIVFTGANTMNTSQGPASGINNLIGSNSATDRITGANLAAIWNITDEDDGNYNAGTLVNFTNFETLIGGTDVDEFIFDADGRIRGQLDGGAQPGGSRDIIDLTARATAVTARISPATITQGVTNLVGSWSSIEELQGNGVAGNTLIGSNGGNVWTLTGANDGTLNALTFSDFPILTGGTSTDSFLLGNAAGSIASISGGSGTDTLSYAGAVAAVTVNVDSTTGGASGVGSTRVANYIGIDSLIGGTASDTLVGTLGVDNIIINGATSGTINTSLPFTGFETVNGNAGNDVYTVTTTGATVSSLVAGGGVDTLIGANRTNAWIMTGAGSGTLNAFAPTTLTFSGMENITGGSGVDTFNFAGGSITGTLNGGGHNDILQLGANNVTLTSNVNGTTTGGLMANFVSIENLQSSGGSTLTGANISNIWRLTGANAGILNSTTLFSGFTNLVGNASQDRLQPYQGYVTSFDAAGGSDVLDYAGTSTTAVPRPYNVTPAMLLNGTVLSGMATFTIDIDNFEIVSGNIYA